MSKISESSWVPNLGVKGWGVTLICVCFYFFYNFWSNGANTLFGLFTETYGWAQTDMSFIVTLGGWLSLIGILGFGALGKKKGARVVCIVGLLLSALSFVILALMNTFAMYAIGVILFQISMSGYAVIGLGMLGSNWFPHKKGIFMGIATIGMTICGAVINPLVLACASSPIGVSLLFWCCALACVILAALMLLVKNNPEEAGAYPDNDRSITREQLQKEFEAAEEYKKHSSWNTARVLKTPQTWLIGIGWGLSMLAASGVMSLLVPTLMAYGHEQTFAVTLLASMWPAGLVGHYLIGVIDQKFGTKRTSILVVVVLIFALLLVTFAGANVVACAVSVALLMFAISGNANVCMSMTTTVFGRQDFETAWSPIQVLYNICNFAGVSVLSLVAASFGQAAIMPAAAIVCVVSVILMAVTPDKQIASNVQAISES